MVGTADLPLHSGKVPLWMLKLMERMGKAIVEAIVEAKGVDAIISGLSDPVWFQAFNNAIGMDWDSSGSTTVLLAVLKSVTWNNPELGFIVLGGKGRYMREVPLEAEHASRHLDIDPARVKAFSKLAARVDSALLQDGYDLYHHAVVVSESGRMVVVQQGMNIQIGMARRYHVDKMHVEEPHSGVAGVAGEALNVTDRDSRGARKLFIELIGEGPRRILNLLHEANAILRHGRTLTYYLEGKPKMPRAYRSYKPIIPDKTLLRAIERLGEFQPSNEIELALAPSLGPKVIRALALIADLIYSTPVSSRDPVTHPLNPYIYAYAVGGKDGIPYRYDKNTAIKTVATLEEAIEKARLGNKEKLNAIIRLRSLIRNPPPHPQP